MKHTKAWFCHRIGKYLMIDGREGSIIVASKQHAIALYLNQRDKNITYTELL
jgi:hypothetical protein